MSSIRTYEDKLKVFCKWLSDNGASYPKIEWPSTDTVGGCRGAKATSHIGTNEVMMEIPVRLMMSPEHAFADPVLGKMFSGAQDLLRGDVMLTVYIMSEILKGDASFYAPYLRILPEPGSIVQWTDEQLQQLEDSNLIYRTRSRGKMLLNTYERTFSALSLRYPEAFPLTKYTHELYVFAWFCVQARAFGRRLPWTALVPFADCLNHANVQTKYDYDVAGNGMFRMYPSGGNFYTAGCEVFNSYGRRPNDNLLLDYGFAILDNMWDAVEVPLGLLQIEDESEHIAAKKVELLYRLGFQRHTVFAFRRSFFPLEALIFARVVVMNEEELMVAEEKIKTANDGRSHVSDAQSRADPDKAFQEARASTSESDSDNSCNELQNEARENMNRAARALEALSASAELMALLFVKNKLCSLRKQWRLTTAEDQELLALLQLRTSYHKSAAVEDGSTDDEMWKSISATTYRLTRKRIIEANIEKIELIEAYLKSFIACNRAKAATEALAAAVPAQSLFVQNELPSSHVLTFLDRASEQSAAIGRMHPSRQIFDEMLTIDSKYSVHQPNSGISPYVTTGVSTNFRDDHRNDSSHEYRLRAYLQKVTSETLRL